jgi:PTS system mannitol-specific IIC component
VLRKKVHSAGFGEVTVVNLAIANLRDDVDLVVTHQDLTDRARQQSPSAFHVSVDNFMASPRYDEIVELLHQTNGEGGEAAEAPAAGPAGGVLAGESIVLSGAATTRDDAIAEAGQLLVATGAVDASYVDAMHERERSVSTYMGNGLAIPHGTNDAKSAIHRSAISFVRYADPVDWNGKPAEFVLGIAGAGDDHLSLLQRVAEVFADPARVDQLRAATTPGDVRAVLEGVRA